tara:strand:+ start:46 stop:264 length:219 start_codon:yes stop_codon:yes gene_type:complete
MDSNNLQSELDFYKSIFETHPDSRVSNLRIKKINGKSIWVDKVHIHSDYKLLQSLDKDDEVKEWLKPIKCSR